MPDAALVQRQHQRAIPVQIQANAILSMSILELQQFIETEAMENPALDVDDSARCPVCGFLAGTGVCPVCGASSERARAARDEPRSEREHLERVIGTFDCEGFDPFRTVAGVSGLLDHLRQQARMTLGGRQLRISDYIIDSRKPCFKFLMKALCHAAHNQKGEISLSLTGGKMGNSTHNPGFGGYTNRTGINNNQIG